MLPRLRTPWTCIKVLLCREYLVGGDITYWNTYYDNLSPSGCGIFPWKDCSIHISYSPLAYADAILKSVNWLKRSEFYIYPFARAKMKTCVVCQFLGLICTYWPSHVLLVQASKVSAIAANHLLLHPQRSSSRFNKVDLDRALPLQFLDVTLSGSFRCHVLSEKKLADNNTVTLSDAFRSPPGKAGCCSIESRESVRCQLLLERAK